MVQKTFTKKLKLPLPFDEAVSDLLKVKPPKKKPKAKSRKKTRTR